METLGPYRLIRMLARGGMGEVYLASLSRESGFEKRVTIKRILPELAGEPSFVELFEREARLAARLNHRNIVQVFDFGKERGSVWLAMEFVDGVDLCTVQELLRQRRERFPPGVALEIGLAVARALDHAQRATDGQGRRLGLVHRDISPQNLLLSFEGDVKLADFGLALDRLAPHAQPGLLQGKIAYMSPEQASGLPVDSRTDLFSLGAVLYELFSGCRAFGGEGDQAQILARVAQAEPLLPLSRAAPELPPALVQVLDRALAQRPEDRHPDAAAFHDALSAAAREAGIAPGEPPLGGWLTALLAPDRPDARPPTLGEHTASAAAPIAGAGTLDAATPVAAPALRPDDHARSTGPRRRAPRRPATWSFLAIGLLLVVGGLLLRHQLAGDQPPTKTMPEAPAEPPQAGPLAPFFVSWSRPATTSAAPEALRPASPEAPASRPAAPTPPRPEPTATPRRETVLPPDRPARTLRPATTSPAPPPTPRPTASRAPGAVVSTTPTSVQDPSPPPAAKGPRVRLAAIDSLVAGRDDAGWQVLGTQGAVFDVPGGPGPPVRLRLQAHGDELVANLDARPWGRVRLDQRLLGNTPLANIPLAVGTRRLEVEGPHGDLTRFEIWIAH